MVVSKRDQQAAPAALDRLPMVMTSAEVARLLRVDPSTLCRWRASGLGPRVTWLSPSIPRYQRVDVLVFLERGAA